MRDMLCLVQPEMRPISCHENKRACSPMRTTNNGLEMATAQPSSRGNKRAENHQSPPTPAPSTRLSGLMKRIQAKANNCQNQLESFVSNVSSAVHLGSHKKSPPAAKNCPQGVVIGPIQSPSPLPRSSYTSFGQKATTEQQQQQDNNRTTTTTTESENKEKNNVTSQGKHTYVIKLATLTPATMHSAYRKSQQQQQQQHQQHVPEGPFKTWNGLASNKTRPDLSLVGFRPDKHVTCIEVTLINNRTGPDSPTTSEPSGKSLTSNGMKTYCFGELPAGDKSPSGTISSRSSSRGSEQFDSGFEEVAQQQLQRKPSPVAPSSTSIIRSIFDKIGGHHHEQRTPKVQAKRSTIRREKAFRQRNKHAWSRAKEIQRNDELLQRFHQIRKRLGEEDELEDGGGMRLSPESPLPSDLLGPLPSIVQTLVRQYDTGGQQRCRDKIVPSRLHSKRSAVGQSKTPAKNIEDIEHNSLNSTQVEFIFFKFGALKISRQIWPFSNRHISLYISFFLLSSMRW